MRIEYVIKKFDRKNYIVRSLYTNIRFWFFFSIIINNQSSKQTLMKKLIAIVALGLLFT